MVDVDKEHRMSDKKNNHRQGGGRKSWTLVEESKRRPNWTIPGTTEGLRFSTRLVTDDAEFGCIWLGPKTSNRTPTVRGAYSDSRGRWTEVEILKNRIREIA